MPQALLHDADAVLETEDVVVVGLVDVLHGRLADGVVAGAAEVREMGWGRIGAVHGQGEEGVPAGVDGEGHGLGFFGFLGGC